MNKIKAPSRIAMGTDLKVVQDPPRKRTAPLKKDLEDALSAAKADLEAFSADRTALQAEIERLKAGQSEEARRLEATVAELEAPKGIKRWLDDNVVSLTSSAFPTVAGLASWASAEIATPWVRATVEGATGPALAWISFLPGILALCILGVSLPHVAQGLQSRFGVSSLQAWSLGVAIDLGLTVSEWTLQLNPIESPSATWTLALSAAMFWVMASFFGREGFLLAQQTAQETQRDERSATDV